MRNLFTQSLWHNTLIPLIIFENSMIAFTIKLSIQETYECGKFEILFIIQCGLEIQPVAKSWCFPLSNRLCCEVDRWMRSG